MANAWSCIVDAHADNSKTGSFLRFTVHCMYVCTHTLLHRAAKLPYTYLLRAAEDQHRVAVVQGGLGESGARC